MIRLVLLINIFIVSVFGSVSVNAPRSFVKGEPYVFSIKASGSNIVFPQIDKIDGNIVSSLGTSNATHIVNGRVNTSIEKKYSLQTSKDFIIPSFEFKIHGQSFYTQEISVIAKKLTKTISNIFDLTIKTNKNDLYVGEDFIVKLLFKYRKDTQITDLNLFKSDFDGFWYKQLNDIKKYEENNFIVQELNYLFFPLKNGKLIVEPMTINASVIDYSRSSNNFFSTPVKTYKIYSNQLDLNVKPLPADINLIGDFNIKASVDKLKLKKNEAVSYKLKISGNGNIEDIKDISLNIDGAVVYENKAKIKAEYDDGLYKGEYNKIFSIIPNKNITIPSIELKYFNKAKNKIITKKSESFDIVLEGKVEKINEVKLEKKNLDKALESKKIDKSVESTLFDKILFFFFGLCFAILICAIYLFVKRNKDEKEFNDIPLVKKIIKAKNKDELLKILIAYISLNKDLDSLIFRLEKNENIKDTKDIKKEVIDFIKISNFKG